MSTSEADVNERPDGRTLNRAHHQQSPDREAGREQRVAGQLVEEDSVARIDQQDGARENRGT